MAQSSGQPSLERAVPQELNYTDCAQILIFGIDSDEGFECRMKNKRGGVEKSDVFS